MEFEGPYFPVVDIVELDDENARIIFEIIEYEKINEKFQATYARAMEQRISDNGFITPQQFGRLLNIYYGFKMQNERWRYDDELN